MLGWSVLKDQNLITKIQMFYVKDLHTIVLIESTSYNGDV